MTTTTPATVSGEQAPARPAAAPLAVLGLALLGLVVLLLALVAGGGGPEVVPAGLPSPGAVTGWGLPLARWTANAAAALTVGGLLVAGVLAPGPADRLSAAGFRAAQGACVTAAVWLLSALATVLLQMSDVIGVPVSQVLDPTIVVNYVRTVPQAQAGLVVAALAVVLAVGCRQALRRSSALLLLLLALAALLPPALTGHAAGSADHDIATSSLVVHVLAAAAWTGGLAAVLLYLRRAPGEVLVGALRAFSSLALLSVAALAVSGVVSATTRLDSLSQLLGSGYGVLVLLKAVSLLALAGLGALHRRRTLPAVAAGEPTAFRRWALIEIALMTVVFALATALSRTPTPGEPVEETLGSPALRALGYDVPPLTAGRLLTEWRPDLIVLTAAALALLLYLRAVARLRAAGTTWPWWRTASWTLGVLAGGAVMVSGVGTYAMALFSVHMGQHMTLTMVVPILLAIGAPVTLALRALPSRPRDGRRGARELLLAALHSRPARLLSHPLVALTLYMTSLYGLYFTPVFEAAMRSHSLHLLMSIHFLAVGALFFWPIIGADPTPRRLSHPGRLMLLLVSLPLHAFFGVVLLGGTDLIAAGWYDELALPWVDPLRDQQLGGGIAWAAGELPTLLVLLAVLPQWYRQDERAARRADRHADADGDHTLTQYNQHLAALAARDQP